MGVIWLDEANGNRFRNKHLYIVSGTSPLKNLVDAGFKVFNDRIRAGYLAEIDDKSDAEYRELGRLKTKYGTTQISKNTMIMLNANGLAALESKIMSFRGDSSGIYNIPNGIIFNMSHGKFYASLVADIDLSIRNKGSDKEVYHLKGASTTATLTCIDAETIKRVKMDQIPDQYGMKDSLGMKYTPTTKELLEMKSTLRPV